MVYESHQHFFEGIHFDQQQAAEELRGTKANYTHRRLSSRTEGPNLASKKIHSF